MCARVCVHLEHSGVIFFILFLFQLTTMFLNHWSSRKWFGSMELIRKNGHRSAKTAAAPCRNTYHPYRDGHCSHQLNVLFWAQRKNHFSASTNDVPARAIAPFLLCQGPQSNRLSPVSILLSLVRSLSLSLSLSLQLAPLLSILWFHKLRGVYYYYYCYYLRIKHSICTFFFFSSLSLVCA